MRLWVLILIVIVVFLLLILVYRFGRDFISQRRGKSLGGGSSVALDSDSYGGKRRRFIRNVNAASRPDSPRRERIFNFLVAGLLGTLMVRLWQLQIIQSRSYRRDAEENMTASVSVSAKRGRIMDRNGVVLVDNRPSLSVVGARDVADDRNVVHRLSLVLGLPIGVIKARLLDATVSSQANRIIAYDVSLRAVSYILEHPTAFAGVSVESRSIRYYPQGNLAAHVIGYTGTISEAELQEAKTSGIIEYESDDVVGKTGAEAAFESVLQGERGKRTYQVDAGGNATDLLSTAEAHSGSDIKLTIDAKLQKDVEEVVNWELKYIREGWNHPCTGAAAVVIDVPTGGILASVSYPTFNPAEFTGGISEERWASLTDEKSNYPMNNRVIAGQYPAASTFKAFSGLAGLKYGVITDKSKVTCEGTWTGFGEKYPQNCWELNGHGEMDFYAAYPNSCDVFFYEEAKGFYLRDDEDQEPLMNTYKDFGFGSLTGAELPGEQPGRVPTPEWKEEYYVDAPQNATWLPGDYSNIIIGQGDLLISPLQLAMAYSNVATGHRLVPHYLYQVLNEKGEATITKEAEEAERQPEIEEHDYELVREALRKTAISYGFDVFPVEIAAKTGTGETGRADLDDYAMFACWAPFKDPKYCVAVAVEQGGGGSTTGLPIARDILSLLFGVEADSSIGSNANSNER